MASKYHKAGNKGEPKEGDFWYMYAVTNGKRVPVRAVYRNRTTVVKRHVPGTICLVGRFYCPFTLED